MLSANKDGFTSFLPIFILFISLFSLMVLERSSSRKLNGSGKSGCPCLVPELRAVVNISPPSFTVLDPFYQIKDVLFHS